MIEILVFIAWLAFVFGMINPRLDKTQEKRILLWYTTLSGERRYLIIW